MYFKKKYGVSRSCGRGCIGEANLKTLHFCGCALAVAAWRAYALSAARQVVLQPVGCAAARQQPPAPQLAADKGGT